MNLLIGILPALLWGSNPIITVKIGGTPLEQMVGACYGQVIIGVIMLMIFRPVMSFSTFLWCFLAGLTWSFAALTQFLSFKYLNVSRSMPISTGLELILTPIVGIIFWNEWNTSADKIIGFISIILLIFGISLTNVHKSSQNNLNYEKGLPFVFMCAVGFVANAVLPKIPNVNGITGTFPQSFGMFVGALVIGLCYEAKKRKHVMLKRATLENIVYGLIDNVGNIFYLTSLKLNGPANAFPLTRLNVVVSTLGGIFILHESKTHKEMAIITLGLIIIITGAFMIANIA